MHANITISSLCHVFIGVVVFLCNVLIGVVYTAHAQLMNGYEIATL